MPPQSAHYNRRPGTITTEHTESTGILLLTISVVFVISLVSLLL